MPKPDGSLYWYEKEKIEAANRPKPEKKKVTKPRQKKTSEVIADVVPMPKPARIPHPLAPKPGRPVVRVKATPELIAAICKEIELGLSIESSCILHGISRSGVDKWRRLNPAVNGQFEKAETAFEQRLVSKINTFACDDVKAATWLLERGRPQRWAQTTKAELTGKDGGPLQQLTIAKTLMSNMSSREDSLKRAKKVDAVDVKAS